MVSIVNNTTGNKTYHFFKERKAESQKHNRKLNIVDINKYHRESHDVVL